MKKKLTFLFINLFAWFILFPTCLTYAEDVVLKPPIQDSCLVEPAPTTNLGSNTHIFVNRLIDHRCRIVVAFDLSSIPPGSQVTSATLSLFKLHEYILGGGTDRTYWVYRLTESWTEYGVSWDYRYATTSWTDPGGTYNTDGGASTQTTTAEGIWISWDVTDIVKGWIEDELPNNGFIIRDSEEGATGSQDSWEFSAKELDLDYSPKLEISYTPPPVGGAVLPLNPLILSPWAMLIIFTLIISYKSLHTK